MLFFRSEEAIDGWCRRVGLPRRPMVRMDQLWSMAVTWYANRLDPESRRPAPDEIRGIFAGIGLIDPFWDPRQDTFT
jgi:hypothetical protein